MKDIHEDHVRLRPLLRDDAESFSASFTAIGWSKPTERFLRYFEEQRSGLRWVRVAEVDGQAAGYVTVLWTASDPRLRSLGIPEIMDLNVLPAFRRQGLGAALVRSAEDEARTRCATIGLRVGLHSGYGPAQRLYVRLGYVPDGTGASVDGFPVAEGVMIALDDDLTLRMTRELR